MYAKIIIDGTDKSRLDIWRKARPDQVKLPEESLELEELSFGLVYGPTRIVYSAREIWKMAEELRARRRAPQWDQLLIYAETTDGRERVNLARYSRDLVEAGWRPEIPVHLLPAPPPDVGPWQFKLKYFTKDGQEVEL